MAAENFIRDLSKYVFLTWTTGRNLCTITTFPGDQRATFNNRLSLPLTHHSYLTTGELSDLILSFGEKSWQIHKALACSHSKWFQKAFTGDFDVSSRKLKRVTTPKYITGEYQQSNRFTR